MSEELPKVPVEVRPRPTEALFEMARQTIFPLCVLRFVKKKDETSPIVTVGVSEKMYRRIKKVYGTDQVIVHCTLPNMILGIYTPTMQRAQDFLQKNKLMLRPKDWVMKAESYMENELGS